MRNNGLLRAISNKKESSCFGFSFKTKKTHWTHVAGRAGVTSEGKGGKQ